MIETNESNPDAVNLFIKAVDFGKTFIISNFQSNIIQSKFLEQLYIMLDKVCQNII